jgi:hypothetical protein
MILIISYFYDTKMVMEKLPRFREPNEEELKWARSIMASDTRVPLSVGMRAARFSVGHHQAKREENRRRYAEEQAGQRASES